MNFIPIQLSEIRPYVRFLTTPNNLTHTVLLTAFEHRLIYIEEGEVRFIIGNREIHAKKNDALLIAAGVEYQMFSLGNTVSTFIYFDLTMKNSCVRTRVFPVGEKIDSDKLLCHYRVLHNGEPVEVLHIPEAVDALNYINCIRNALNNSTGGNYQDEIISGYMVIVIALLFERLNNIGEHNAENDVANLAVNYIHDHYKDNISQDKIASAINFHRSYINRCVKQETGMSVYQYLIHYRLEQALQLLMYTNLSISAIAETTGFNNVKYFSTVFKKHYGLSPSKIIK